MWWYAGNPGTGRSENGWLERKIAGKPLRAAVICFIATAVLAVALWLTMHPLFFVFGVLFFLMSLWLFIYSLIRRGMDSLEQRSKGN